MNRIVLLATLLFSPTASLAADPTILLDTFEDDTVGLAPDAPDVGSAFYGSDGDYAVAASPSGQQLRSTCTAPEALFTDWTTSNPTAGSTRLTYRILLVSGTALHSSTAYKTAITLRDEGGNSAASDWSWGQDAIWRRNGNISHGAYSPDTEYIFVWDFDADASTVSLAISGVTVLDQVAWGSTIAGLENFTQVSNGSSDVAVQLDEIRAVGGHVFSSGFDVGSPDEWSAYSPSALPGDECHLPGLLGQGIDAPGTLAAHSGASGDDSPGCGVDDTIDRWILYTAQCTGTATISTCLPATEFDTVLAAYDGCGGAQVTCNDDAIGAPAECDLVGSNRKSQISFAVTAGASYPIRVSAYQDTFPAPDATEFALRVECAPTP